MLKTKHFDVNGNDLQVTEFSCREAIKLFSYTIKYFAGTFGGLIKIFSKSTEGQSTEEFEVDFFNSIIECLQIFAKDIDPEKMDLYVVDMLKKSVYKGNLITDKNFGELFGSDWDSMIKCLANSIIFNFGDFFLNLVNTLKQQTADQTN